MLHSNRPIATDVDNLCFYSLSVNCPEMIDLLAAFLLHLDLTCLYMLLTAVQKAQTPTVTSAILGFLGQRSWIGEMQHLK